MIGQCRERSTLVLGAVLLLGPIKAQEHSAELDAINKRGLRPHQAGTFANALPIAGEYIGAAAVKFGDRTSAIRLGGGKGAWRDARLSSRSAALGQEGQARACDAPRRPVLPVDRA